MSNKVDTGGKRLNLFPAKKQKKKLPVDDKVFNMMEAVADKSYVNISDMSQPKVEKSTKSIHNALMAAGMTPAYGNIADVADATLYALEGEFGEAAWSMAAAIPIIGQMVAGRKAAKVAKEAGQEMVTLYRGVDKWHPGEMVEKGKFVGGGGYDKLTHRFKGIDKSDKSIWLSEKKHIAEGYAGAKSFWSDAAMTKRVTKPRTGPLLKFEIPKSYITKFGKYEDSMGEWAFRFDKGIPKEFLTKVHK